ncbi:MAG: ABC transporter substrate-binding protein [Methylophaga sp.]|nr:ABC transporter substrate-binding protein [Methylophaga sp.]
MRQFWPLILFLVIFLVALFGLNNAPVTKKSPPIMPQRIITLSPSITEIAFALGLDDEVVAVTRYCDYPAKVNSLPKVGGFVDPNIEAIVALQPDLVILGATRQYTVDQLQQLNIPTLAVYTTNLSDIKDSIKIIGDATQHQQQAQTLLAHIEQQISDVADKVSTLSRPKVMVTMGHSMGSEHVKNIYIAGQHDFYNDLILLAGGKNAYQGKHLKVPSLSIEGIMQINPDVILDVFPEASDHDADLSQVKRQWQSLKHVNAIKNNRFHIIEENYATIPGPRIFKLLNKMARLIHPELEWDEPAQ